MAAHEEPLWAESSPTYGYVLSRMRRPPSVNPPLPRFRHSVATQRERSPIPKNVSDDVRAPPLKEPPASQQLSPPPPKQQHHHVQQRQHEHIEVLNNQGEAPCLPDPQALPRIPRPRHMATSHSMPQLSPRTRPSSQVSATTTRANTSYSNMREVLPLAMPSTRSAVSLAPSSSDANTFGGKHNASGRPRSTQHAATPLKRLTLHEAVQLLEGLPWLRSMQKRELLLFAQVAIGHQRRVKRFQVLYREGSASNFMYIVGRGQMALRTADNDVSQGLVPAEDSGGQVVGVGGTFGEAALLDNAPVRRATATALVPVRLQSYLQAHLQSYLQAYLQSYLQAHLQPYRQAREALRPWARPCPDAYPILFLCTRPHSTLPQVDSSARKLIVPSG